MNTTNIHSEVIQALKALPKYPAKPIMGRGYARERFDYDFTNKSAAELFRSTPANHVYVSKYGGVSRYVSPEALHVMMPVFAQIDAEIEASRAKRATADQKKKTKAIEKVCATWQQADRITSGMLWDMDEVSEDGQTITFKSRKGASVTMTLAECKAVIGSDVSSRPYDRIRRAAFAKFGRGPRGESPVQIRAATLEKSALTEEEQVEFKMLLAASAHPYTGRTLELKQKSGLSWTEIESSK